MAAWVSNNRQRLLQLIGTLLAVVFLTFLLKEEGWIEILVAMQAIKITDLVWVAILFAISRIAIVSRWHVLLQSGGVDIRFKNSLGLTFTGLFASNFLPTTIGGDVVRLAGAMQMGFDRAVCLASIAADRYNPRCNIPVFGRIIATTLGIPKTHTFHIFHLAEKTRRPAGIIGLYLDPHALRLRIDLRFRG